MTLSLPQQRIGKSGRPVQFSPQARQFESRVERALEVFEETGNLDFLDHSRAFYNRPSPLDVKTVRAKLAQFSEAFDSAPECPTGSFVGEVDGRQTSAGNRVAGWEKGGHRDDGYFKTIDVTERPHNHSALSGTIIHFRGPQMTALTLEEVRMGDELASSYQALSLDADHPERSFQTSLMEGNKAFWRG